MDSWRAGGNEKPARFASRRFGSAVVACTQAPMGPLLRERACARSMLLVVVRLDEGRGVVVQLLQRRQVRVYHVARREERVRNVLLQRRRDRQVLHLVDRGV